MRKVLATILAATIALSMISCSNASTPSQDTGSDSEQTAPVCASISMVKTPG